MNTHTKKDIRSEHIANRELKLTLSGNDISNGLDEYCELNRAKANKRDAKLAQWFVHTPLMRRF